ncbi:MAG: UDP-glucose 4-epimerase, partial [Deltaproteobacteria bacterium]|nr:UDP-glucose 4-epimerase [Deltaproteobacteria bacterium]
KKIENQTFNVGYQNMSINEIANLVKEVVEQEYPGKDKIEIIKTSSDDNRSYHINSDKIERILGFKPKRSIELAVKDLCDAFKENKILNSFDNDLYFNVNRLKNISAK